MARLHGGWNVHCNRVLGGFFGTVGARSRGSHYPATRRGEHSVSHRKRPVGRGEPPARRDAIAATRSQPPARRHQWKVGCNSGTCREANARIGKANDGIALTISELGETKKVLAQTNSKLSVIDNVFQRFSLRKSEATVAGRGDTPRPH